MADTSANLMMNPQFAGFGSETKSLKGPICEGWSIAHKGTPHRYEFASKKTTRQNEHFLEIDLKAADNWFRILGQLPADIFLHERFYFRMALAASPSAHADLISKIAIMEFDERGVGSVFVALWGKTRAVETPNYIDTVFAIPRPFDPEKQYRFCIQLAKPGRVFIGNPYLIPIEKFSLRPNLAAFLARDKNANDDASALPYLNHAGGHFGSLKKLNADMSRACKSGRGAWLLGVLGLAVRLEAYDTALGLVNFLAQGVDVLNPDEELQFLQLSVETYTALGDEASLYELYLKHSRTFIKDDALVTAITSFVQDKFTAEMSRYVLPSKKANIFALTKDILRSDNKGQFLIEAGKIGDSHGNKRLVMANCFAGNNAAFYLKTLNAYLADYGLPALTHIAFDTNNAMKTIAFAPVKPVESPLKVSVIIAAYNCEDTIDYALSSVLAQSYRNIEVLVCDDQSTDGTMARINAFASDPRVKIFQSRKNQGPYQIRNNLMEEATGDIITFHDSDDIVSPVRIETQVEGMMVKDAAMSLGRWIRMMPCGSFVTFKDHQSMRMCVNSLMFYRDVYKRVGPFRPTLCAGDTDFYEAARAWYGNERTLQVMKPLVFGLWSDGSLTKQTGIEALSDGYRAPKRRAYAEASSRQRMLGKAVVSDDDILAVLKHHGLYRDDGGISKA